MVKMNARTVAQSWPPVAMNSENPPVSAVMIERVKTSGRSGWPLIPIASNPTITPDHSATAPKTENPKRGE